jgi:hypothetical protein
LAIGSQFPEPCPEDGFSQVHCTIVPVARLPTNTAPLVLPVMLLVMPLVVTTGGGTPPGYCTEGVVRLMLAVTLGTTETKPLPESDVAGIPPITAHHIGGSPEASDDVAAGQKKMLPDFSLSTTKPAGVAACLRYGVWAVAVAGTATVPPMMVASARATTRKEFFTERPHERPLVAKI